METPVVHSFHIPVMGLSYTIDSPIRVAHYGISSVVSITDDELIEKMSALYSEKFSIPYQEISQKFLKLRDSSLLSQYEHGAIKHLCEASIDTKHPIFLFSNANKCSALR